MKQKKYKVAYKNRFCSGSYTSVPMIQITGQWLEELGYHIGDSVMMEYDKSGIHIRLLTQVEQKIEEKAALELSIKKKQKELSSLQKRIASIGFLTL